MLKIKSEEEVFAFLEGFLTSIFRTKIQEIGALLDALEEDIPIVFRVLGFEYLLKNFKTLDKKETFGFGKEMPQNLFSKIAKEIGPDLLFYFRGVVMKNPSAGNLAESVWEKIIVFEKRDYRLVALTLILFDDFVPYRQLSFSSAEVDYFFSEYSAASRDKGIKEEEKELSIEMKNFISRSLFAVYGIKDYNLAVIWNLIRRGESEEARFRMFRIYSECLEDWLTTASHKKVEYLVEEIYA